MTADVLFPTSADEAASLYGTGEGITVFAGGTILLPEIASGRVRPGRALLLHRSGLDSASVNGSRVTIGAMVPIAELTDSEDTALAQVARHIADEEVRRNATVGGNLCAPPGADAQRGDLGAALIALGAQVRSVGAGGERTEPVEDFLAGDRAGRLLLDVSYERTGGRSATASLRRRHAHSYAIATVAAAKNGDGVRIGITGVGPTAVRARSAEASGNPDDVLQDVEPIDDAVASADYRCAVLPKLVREALDQLERA
jgi:aerobic carbon-monoxide dehydrogenase medium subunit